MATGNAGESAWRKAIAFYRLIAKWKQKRLKSIKTYSREHYLQV